MNASPHRPGHVLAVWIAVLALGAPALAQPHTDRETGYRIAPPKDFEKTDGSVFDWDAFLDRGGATESITAADHRLVSFRKPRPVKSITDWGQDYAMTCYYFPADIEKEIGDTGDKRFAGARLYRSFADYARDRIKGFYFSREKQIEIAGYPGMLYEMKFEKLVDTPQHWLALAWDIAGGQFAAVYSCDEESFRKMRGQFLASANSFRLLEDEGLNWMGLRDPDRQKPSGPSEIQKRAREKMSPAELEEWRKERREEAYEKEVEELDRGWRHKRVGGYLVVSQEDGRYTSRVCKQIQAMHDWCEDTFGDIEFHYTDRPPYHPGGGIVRIDERDPSGFGVTGSIVGGTRIPRIQVQRTTSGDGFELRRINDFVFESWMNSKHRALQWELPGWLRFGLSELMGRGELKGRRIRFDLDANDLRQRMRWMGEPGQGDPEWIPLERLFSMSYSEIFQSREAGAEAICVVHYFLAGPGRRSSKTKHLIPDYIASLSKTMAAKSAARREAMNSKAEKDSSKELTEEELLAREDAEYEKRRKEGGDEEIARKVFDLTFGYWTPDEWSQVDRAAAAYTMRMIR